MKIGKIILVLVLFFGFMGSNVLVEGQDADDYGKLSIRIVDPISEEPVNEIFVVTLFACEVGDYPSRYLKQRKTDKKGYLLLDVLPGQYCLHFSPDSLNSKYCNEPYHFIIEDDQFYLPVVIEKGKVTKFIKKATFAGAIKIKLLDTSGRIIDPTSELPRGASIVIFIDSRNYLSGQAQVDEMTGGEMIIGSLYPDKYFLKLDFRRTGYKSFSYEDVLVKKNGITVVDCVIDLNDITGIEGKIVDINGSPAKGIEISMIPQFPVDGDFNDISDKDGNYRITGLPEGSYLIGTFSFGCFKAVVG